MLADIGGDDPEGEFDAEDKKDFEKMHTKFQEALRLRHGGLCQQYVRDRYAKVAMDDKWAMARKIRAATLANADDKGEDGVRARGARADAEAALVTGPIAEELEDNDDDDGTSAANAALQDQAEAEEAAGGLSAEVNGVLRGGSEVVLDAETLAMARDGARLQQQWRAHGASAISRAEREETFDDEVSHPAPTGNPLLQRRRGRAGRAGGSSGGGGVA